MGPRTPVPSRDQGEDARRTRRGFRRPIAQHHGLRHQASRLLLGTWDSAPKYGETEGPYVGEHYRVY